MPQQPCSSSTSLTSNLRQLTPSKLLCLIYAEDINSVSFAIKRDISHKNDLSRMRKQEWINMKRRNFKMSNASHIWSHQHNHNTFNNKKHVMKCSVELYEIVSACMYYTLDQNLIDLGLPAGFQEDLKMPIQAWRWRFVPTCIEDWRCEELNFLPCWRMEMWRTYTRLASVVHMGNRLKIDHCFIVSCMPNVLNVQF